MPLALSHFAVLAMTEGLVDPVPPWSLWGHGWRPTGGGWHAPRTLPVTTAQLFLLAVPIGGVVALGALWLDQHSR